MIQIVEYKETNNDIIIGFRKYSFLVYGMIEKKKALGLTKNRIIQMVYEDIKHSIDYETLRYESGQSNSIITDKTGEEFVPDIPIVKTVILNLDKYNIQFEQNQGSTMITLSSVIKDQYKNNIRANVVYSTEIGIIQGNILTVSSVTDTINFTVTARIGEEVSDKKIVTLNPYLEIKEEPSEIEILRQEQMESNTKIATELTSVKKTLSILPPVTNPTTLQDYQQNKIYQLKTECNQTIIDGFYSDCRGVTELYSCSQLDQDNIRGYIAMLGVNPNINIMWKSANENICTPFTSEQIIELGGDMINHIQEYIYQFELLRNKVLECGDIGSVGEIKWESIFLNM